MAYVMIGNNRYALRPSGANCGDDFEHNPRYTPRTAPPHIRKKWAKLGAKVRRKLSPYKKEIKSLKQSLIECNQKFWDLMRSDGDRAEDRLSAENPELLLVGNNPSLRQYVQKWTKNKGGKIVKRKRRKKARNMTLTVRMGGRKRSWHSLVKQYGVKGARKHWRGKRKYHGGRLISNNKKRRGKRRKARNRRRTFRRRR